MDYLGEYDAYDRPYVYEPDPRDRLQVLVFLDGRLVESRSGEAEGTRYEALARRFDRERQPIEREVPKADWERGWRRSTRSSAAGSRCSPSMRSR